MKLIYILIIILSVQDILSNMRYTENEETIRDLEYRIEQLEKGNQP